MTTIEYQNGNATVTLNSNGSRIVTYDNDLKLDYPLNIDIKVMSKCQFGRNPKTGKSFCSFCHESATTDGIECDYEQLKEKLNELPAGIELAIGGNELTNGLMDFLDWCLHKGYVCNLTINQGHIKRDFDNIKHAIENNLIKGLGISYRKDLHWSVPDYILNYSNTVFHVICGIDTIDEVNNLKQYGVKKILVLGEKDFGFNKGKVNTQSLIHKQWRWWIQRLFKEFEVVSFDNLALEQLHIKRFFTEKDYNTFNQQEHSFYIDAVTQTLAPSSRSDKRTPWKGYTLKNYYYDNNIN